MALDSKHPLYGPMLPLWNQMRHCYAGENTVKDQGTAYLPATMSMVKDGMDKATDKGFIAYQAYKARAVYPDNVKDAIDALVGVLNRKPATIEVPAGMEDMLDEITIDGETAHTLLRRIHEAQLTTGRMGLLVELPTGLTVDKAMPYLVPYQAEAIINWNMGLREKGKQELQLCVLDESQQELDQAFSWKLIKKYRMLRLADEAIVAANTGVQLGNYVVATTRDSVDIPATVIQPSLAGKPLPYIPFVFINPGDMVSDPTYPPLLGLSNICLSIYRGEADYRQSLFMQGQATFVIKGAEDEIDPEGGGKKETRVGAGSVLNLPTDGDAFFAEVKGAGLGEMRQALENDKEVAAQRSTQLLDTSNSSQQSGDALQIRLAASTASLTQIARVSAEGLEMALKIAAEWKGLDKKKVKVTPNLEFSSTELGGQELLYLVQAKKMGAPISNDTIHQLMQKRELTTKTLDEELDEIDGEEPLGLGGGGLPGGVDPLTGKPVPTATAPAKTATKPVNKNATANSK